MTDLALAGLVAAGLLVSTQKSTPPPPPAPTAPPPQPPGIVDTLVDVSREVRAWFETYEDRTAGQFELTNED